MLVWAHIQPSSSKVYQTTFLNLFSWPEPDKSGKWWRRLYSQPGGSYRKLQPRLMDRVARRESSVLLIHHNPTSLQIPLCCQLTPCTCYAVSGKTLLAENDRSEAMLSVSHSCLWTAAQGTELFPNTQQKLYKPAQKARVDIMPFLMQVNRLIIS